MEQKIEKKTIKLRDLKPTKDVKGGFGRGGGRLRHSQGSIRNNR